MSYMLDGWDLWESEKNLQYLLDTCDSPELNVSRTEELKTHKNEALGIPTGISVCQGYVDDHGNIIDPVEMFCYTGGGLLKDKNNNSLEQPTVSDSNVLPCNVQECITEQSPDNVGTVDTFCDTENILLKDDNGADLSEANIAIDDRDGPRVCLQEYVHNQCNYNGHILCNIGTDGMFIKSEIVSHVDSTPKGILLPLSPSIPREERYDKYFSCEICGSILASKYNLRKHILITHNVEKPFDCDVCGGMFKRKGDLKAHKLTHSDEKPFACPFCERSFKRNGDLKEHILTHSDGKPYSCHTCGNRFTQYSTLRTHELTHSGENPFSCNICGRTFSVKTNLTAHKLTHSREQPFSCEICGKRFSLKGNLKRHKSIHGDDIV